MKTVTLKETRHGESVPTATNVKTNPTSVTCFGENLELYKDLTNDERNSFMKKILLQFYRFEMFNLAKIS